jgi:hypothetical protein
MSLINSLLGFLKQEAYIRSTVDVNLFKTLCEIKFIPPFKVTKWKADIYPQPDADFLICFRNSTVRAEQGLCWTKCHIIPYWADPLHATNIFVLGDIKLAS